MCRSACCVRCDGRGDGKNGIDRGRRLGLLRRSLAFNVRHIEMQVTMLFFAVMSGCMVVFVYLTRHEPSVWQSFIRDCQCQLLHEEQAAHVRSCRLENSFRVCHVSNALSGNIVCLVG